MQELWRQNDSDKMYQDDPQDMSKTDDKRLILLWDCIMQAQKDIWAGRHGNQQR